MVDAYGSYDTDSLNDEDLALFVKRFKNFFSDWGRAIHETNPLKVLKNPRASLVESPKVRKTRQDRTRTQKASSAMSIWAMVIFRLSKIK